MEASLLSLSVLEVAMGEFELGGGGRSGLVW